MANPNLLAITNVQAKVLYSGQLASGDTAVCTAGASESVKLGALILCNTNGTGGAAVTISVGIIPSGGSVDGTHKVVSSYSLGAGETIVVDELAGQFLDAGAKVNVNVGTGAVVDGTLSGISLS